MSYYKGKRNHKKQGISRYILRMAKKIKAILLKGGKCNICGISDLDRPWIFQFHHLDKKEKLFGIGMLINDFGIIKDELEKCICVCENCHRKIHSDEKNRDKTSINKILLLGYKGVNACECCGYDECIRSLDFHHTKDKKFELADVVWKGYEFIQQYEDVIKDELDKCIVLCANCHRDIHADRNIFQQYKSKIYEKMEILKDYTNRIDYNKVLELNKLGLTQKEISDKLGCGISSVCEILKKNGIHTDIVKKILDVEKIIELRKQGKTNVEIGKIIGCNRFSIAGAIKRYNQKNT